MIGVRLPFYGVQVNFFMIHLLIPPHVCNQEIAVRRNQLAVHFVDISVVERRAESGYEATPLWPREFFPRFPAARRQTEVCLHLWIGCGTWSNPLKVSGQRQVPI
jgi:hypothetical protein